ncbi:unnamed protein product [Lathyrus sativus]|nr:unnamed protein product [Lathyrus sativus]
MGIYDQSVFADVGGFHNFCRQDLYACRVPIPPTIYGLRQIIRIQLGSCCVGYPLQSSWRCFYVQLQASWWLSYSSIVLDSQVFSNTWKRGENWIPAQNCGLPRAIRWSYKQGVLKVDELRPVLDEMTPADIIWQPFEDHRVWCQFDEICLYRGCRKWGDVIVLYFPERCIHQFGYKQYTPPPPPDYMMADDIDVDWIGYHHSVFTVIRPTSLTTTPSEIDYGYLEWYYRVSHPRLIPPRYDTPREIWVSLYDARPFDLSWARVSTLIHRYLRQVDAEEDDPQFADLFEALRISRSH